MKKKKFYTLFLAPKKQSGKNWQVNEVILNALLLSTICLFIISLGVAVVSHFIGGDPLSIRYMVVVGDLAVVTYLYFRSRKGDARFAALFLLLVYATLVVFIYASVGTHNPRGILLAGFLIPLAGILLGARYALVAVALNVGLLVTMHCFVPYGPKVLGFDDVIMICVMFGMMGFVSWLSSRQVQHAKTRALRYQAALKKERDNLELKIKERTKELETVQLDKMQQTHRFTELGYFSTAMLHDLANHLSTISLDVATLEGKKKSDVTDRIKQNISYIESMVGHTREHIRGEKRIMTFDPGQEITWLIKSLGRNSEKKGVTINYTPPEAPLHYTGNIVGFRQVVSGLVMNAVDAYAETRKKDKLVDVRITQTDQSLKIIVHDTGKGISAGQRIHIFEPFYSTKTSGMGMGLFIAKQLVEIDFKGEITVKSTPGKGTAFTISLPLV